MRKRLEGKTAIVTGAGRGIGSAIARELGETGANVIVNYSTSASSAEELAEEIRTLGPKALAIKADVTDIRASTQHGQQGDGDIWAN